MKVPAATRREIERLREEFSLEARWNPLLLQALVHSSWVYENVKAIQATKQSDNRCLAFVGSEVAWCERARSLAAATVRERFEEVVLHTPTDEELAPCSVALGLHPAMLLGKGEEKGRGSKTSISANALQAVIAVIYVALDSPEALTPLLPERWRGLREVLTNGMNSDTNVEEELLRLSTDPTNGQTSASDLENETVAEVADAISAVEELIHPRRKFGRRISAAENKAIEERAVAVTRHHFENVLGYKTEDVGATMSYDIHATSRDGQEIRIEVKGTTGDGSSVVLTRREVELHSAAHPHNALAVVRGIALDCSGNLPTATGGELVIVMPWTIDPSCLTPISYDFKTGL